MERKVIDGGWYCDALPSGAWVACRHADTVLETWIGDMAPPDRLLFPRVSDDGLKIAGIAHGSDIAHESFNGGPWVPRGKACGPNGLIYDAAGTLHVSDCGPGIGSQGYRYATSVGIVTGDQSYSPKHGIDLFEWTDLGHGYRVGQGPDDNGAWFFDGQSYYEVITGRARFIRARFDGETVAMACWVEPHCSEIVWATVDEIRNATKPDGSPLFPAKASPRLPKPDPQPVPVPTPVPVPPVEVPPVSETMMLPADVHATYAAVVAKYPHAGDDDMRRSANIKAVQTVRLRHGRQWATKTEHNTGWASASKDGLVNIPSLLTNSDNNIHGLSVPMFIWDMINGGSRQPVDPHESHHLRNAYALVPAPFDWLAEQGVPGTPVPPVIVAPPQQPSVDLSAVMAKLDELQSAIEGLHDEFSQYRLEAADSEIHIRNEIRAHLSPPYSGTAKAGWPVGTVSFTLTPKEQP